MQQGNSTTSVGTNGSLKVDSTTIKQQEFLVVQSQKTINQLEDSIEKISTQKTGITPQYIVRYKDTLRMADTSLRYTNDTTALYSQAVIDSLANTLDLLRAKALIVPRYFLDSSRYFKLKGIVKRTGVDIYDLEVYNKTSVIIGSKGAWYEPKTVVVNVAQSNPLLTSDSYQSYMYKPAEKRWSIVAGPSLLFNGKSFSEGIGVTAGYRIW